jgi:hypothetical protein
LRKTSEAFKTSQAWLAPFQCELLKEPKKENSIKVKSTISINFVLCTKQLKQGIYIMYLELSKREKKIARELIEKGLREEFKRGMLSFDAILQEWKSEDGDIKESYYKIFSAVKDFDKGIARRYDGITGSRYLITVIGQLIDELYDVSEIEGFSPEVKNAILGMIKRDE